MLRCTTFALLCTLALPQAALARDPLDRVTGTEGWREGASSDPKIEWREWLKARAAWREARRTLLIEAARNRQLAALRRRGRARGRAVHKVMRARKNIWRRAAPAQPRSGIRIYRGSADEDDEDEDGGAKVPVERLDNSGQAIDGEGDRLFDKPSRRKR